MKRFDPAIGSSVGHFIKVLWMSVLHYYGHFELRWLSVSYLTTH